MNEVLEKIDEVKYLAQENTPYYRSIMKTFYNKYEQAEYWLYKEDVYECIKDNFNNSNHLIMLKFFILTLSFCSCFRNSVHYIQSRL